MKISLYNILKLIILYNDLVRKWDVCRARSEERRRHIIMGENMNEEALTADGQKDDDIDYVEDREELTEERIKDMLDAREYKELKDQIVDIVNGEMEEYDIDELSAHIQELYDDGEMSSSQYDDLMSYIQDLQ